MNSAIISFLPFFIVGADVIVVVAAYVSVLHSKGYYIPQICLWNKQKEKSTRIFLFCLRISHHDQFMAGSDSSLIFILSHFRSLINQ